MSNSQGFRARLHDILNNHGEQDPRPTLLFSWAMTVLVLANVLAIVLESDSDLQRAYGPAFDFFDAFSITFFSLEYLLRIWSAPDSRQAHSSSAVSRLKYMGSFHGVIDLLAILPFFLQTLLPGLDLRILRVVRILRILKLSHYSTALEDLIAAIWAERASFISALYLLALSILITSCLIHYAEHDLQPDKFGSIAGSMWWSLVTITTVGYGDAVPITPVGKVIGAFTALSGVLTVALLSGIVASAFSTRMRRQEIEFTTELEQILRDGEMSDKEARTVEHLRQEFDITQAHAHTLIQHIREQREAYHRHSRKTPKR